MSTGGHEIQLRAAAQPPVDFTTPDVDLDMWAASMAKAGEIGQALARTEFVPKSLRKNDPGATTAAVAAAVLTGKEIGMRPMAALRSIDVIEGTPALRVVALRALVLQAGHDIWVVESTQTRAIVSGLRRGSTHEQTSTWTLDRAKTAGLANKPNWRSHPGAMLIARATAEVARLIAPDVLLGLPYAAEELVDGDVTDEPEPLEQDAPEPPKRRTAQRKTRRAAPRAVVDVPLPPPAAAEVDEPDLDDDEGDDSGNRNPENVTQPADDGDSPDRVEGSADAGDIEPEEVQAELVEPDDAQPDPVSLEQLQKMRTMFIRLGIARLDQRLRYVLDVIDREITGAAELTMIEASDVLRQLDADVTAAEEFAGPPPDDETTF